jgi:hypothetical protein
VSQLRQLEHPAVANGPYRCVNFPFFRIQEELAGRKVHIASHPASGLCNLDSQTPPADGVAAQHTASLRPHIRYIFPLLYCVSARVETWSDYDTDDARAELCFHQGPGPCVTRAACDTRGVR